MRSPRRTFTDMTQLAACSDLFMVLLRFKSTYSEMTMDEIEITMYEL